jgi:hypothetical protein
MTAANDAPSGTGRSASEPGARFGLGTAVALIMGSIIGVGIFNSDSHDGSNTSPRAETFGPSSQPRSHASSPASYGPR